jgi:hypothetical protein
MSTPQIRTLKRALEKLVKKERLAAALGITVEDLEDYLTGKKPLPNNIFMAALDIVAAQR